jgi:hypothetical protein
VLPYRIQASADLSYGSGFLNGDGPTHLADHAEVSFSLPKSIGERLSVGFTAQNIADGRYLLDNSYTFGGTPWNYPRQVSGEIRYRFHFLGAISISGNSHVPQRGHLALCWFAESGGEVTA